MPIGSISSYVKQSALQKNTTRKMMDFSAQVPTTGLFPESKPTAKVNSMRISLITNKLNSGDEIGVEDLEYLRKNDPDLYAKAVRIVKERKEFGQKLRQCKTKEEALAMKSSKTLQLASMLSNGEQGANEGVFWSMKSIEKAFAAFAQSTSYSRLPDSAQKKEKKKAKTDVVSLNHLFAQRNQNAALAMLKKQKKTAQKTPLAAPQSQGHTAQKAPQNQGKAIRKDQAFFSSARAANLFKKLEENT